MALLGVDQKVFDSFQAGVERELSNLRQEIKARATDSEEVAKTAANNAKAIEEKILATKTTIDTALTELVSINSEAKAELEETKKTSLLVAKEQESTAEVLGSTKAAYASILEIKTAIETQVVDIATNYAAIKSALLESQKLPEQVELAKSLLAASTALNEDMISLQTHSMKKKMEMDEFHKKVFGSDIKASDGTISHVDGLIDELKSAYDGIEKSTNELSGEIKELTGEITKKHEDKLQQTNETFEALINKSSSRFDAINTQITGLLPGAMAEGLSAAYESKKNDETLSQKKYEINFTVAIALMVAVSLIPFCVDIYLLGWKGSDLVQVIKDTPSLIVSILPLYFPVLWLAYSSNKKLNLSKRLIEEYTHKAVLGKTFSGLSNQIESLPRDNLVRDELRTRLLFNLLQVSSENPGKLITDYDKSDHPLMDALENSAKLSDSMEALSKIPGFTAISKKLGESADRILKAESQKVENGLAAQEAITAPGTKVIP